ncbi:hypothetical protein T492DRAFT_981955 [Pavlovales sp. CCMP2436]|nr:hypothetical protein T492DRAFT_981955 [Pavlovales sp. CCMP2436]
MRRKLTKESQYPLKVPLLAASVIFVGKGASDALLTFAKFSAGMRGVSLDETFLGTPVLGIDAACVVLGCLLGFFTWRTMRDAP